MAITHVNTQQTADAGGTTVAVTKPTGLADGDVLIAHIAVAATGAHTAPAGWVQIGALVTAAFITASVWYKVVTNAAGEGASYTFTTSTGSKTGKVAAYRGVSVNNPINVFGSSLAGTSGPAVAPSVTTTRANCWVVATWIHNGNGALSDPAGMTVRAEDESGAGTTSSQLADIAVPAVGATATYSSTLTSAAFWIAHTIALNEAPANEIRFVAGASGSVDGGTAIPVSKPTGTVDGDLMILAVATDEENITTPSGWTLLQNDVNGGMAVFYKVAASEGGSYSITISSGDGAAVIATYRNVAATSPINASGDAHTFASGAILDVPNNTSTIADGLAVHIGGMGGDLSMLLTAHANATSRVEFDNSGAIAAAAGIADELLGAAGTVTGRDWTLSAENGNRYGCLIVIAPSAGVTVRIAMLL